MAGNTVVSSELLKLMQSFHLSYVILIEHGNLDFDLISKEEKERLKIAFTNFKTKLSKEKPKFKGDADKSAIDVIVSSCEAIINEL